MADTLLSNHMADTFLINHYAEQAISREDAVAQAYRAAGFTDVICADVQDMHAADASTGCYECTVEGYTISVYDGLYGGYYVEGNIYVDYTDDGDVYRLYAEYAEPIHYEYLSDYIPRFRAAQGRA